MQLDELQSVRDRERQTDKLQQLRASFYEDAGEFIQQLRAERDRAAERADDPFDAPEVNRLTDEINTAEQTVEAIYEKRVGKIVKAASFAAADLPAEADGMTAEEQELFDQLVADIKNNRDHVLDVLAGEEPSSGSHSPTDTVESTAHAAENQAHPAGSHRDEASTKGAETPSDHLGETAEQNKPQTQASPPEPTDAKGTDGSPGGIPPEANTGVSNSSVESTPTSNGSGQPNQSDGSVPAAELMGGGPDGTEESTQVPPDTGPQQSANQPVREDGGTTRASGANTQSPSEVSAPASSAEQAIRRETVRITDDVDTFVGSDDRDYDLERNDVVTLPATNADVLVERGSAEEIE